METEDTAIEMEISTIPPKPKPPDIHKEINSQLPENPPISFKDKLIRGEVGMDIIIDTTDSISNTMPTTASHIPSKDPLASKEKRISLSQEDRVRMYMPRKYSIIIKLQGKRTLHQIL